MKRRHCRNFPDEPFGAGSRLFRPEPNLRGPVVLRLDSWLFFFPMSQVRPKAERVGEIAAKVVVQLLFATGKSFTVDGLREKLREFYREEVRPELRAVAALNNVELLTALISCNRQLGLVGLQLRILNGAVSLLTTEVQNKALGAYLSEQGTASANLDLTTATLEVLACIAFKQPISQAEIDRLFDVDK